MILVTGATGLIGSHLLYHLSQNGGAIRALYRTTDTLNAVKKVFLFYGDNTEALFNTIEWHKADITDLPQLTDAFKDVTHVYHCAALISFDERDYGKLKKINIEGTANIVNLCLIHRVRKLCHVSSVAALGNGRDGELITENTPWNPDADNSSYAITKYGAEMEAWRGAQEGLPVVVVNPGIVLGAGFPHNGSSQLFSMVKNGLKYYTKGVTGVVAVEDVAAAMVKLMESDRTDKRYIVVAENLSYKELFTAIAEAMNLNPPKKEIKPWLLTTLRYLDGLRSRLSGKKRILTKYTVRSAFRINRYSSALLKKDLNVEFSSLSDAIRRISRFH